MTKPSTDRSPAGRPPAGRPTPIRSAFRGLVRAVSWHRRKLAVTAAVLAVLCGVQAAAPPSTETTPVVVAAAALPGGTVLTDHHLRITDFPPDHLPEQAVTDPADVLGRTVAAPVTTGQVLTEVSVVSPGQLPADGDRVLTPVEVDAGGLAHLLVVGDTVDLVAVVGGDDLGAETGAEVIARQARLASIAAPANAGALGGAAAQQTTVLVEVTEPEALHLAAVNTALRVLLR